MIEKVADEIVEKLKHGDKVVYQPIEVNSNNKSSV